MLITFQVKAETHKNYTMDVSSEINRMLDFSNHNPFEIRLRGTSDKNRVCEVLAVQTLSDSGVQSYSLTSAISGKKPATFKFKAGLRKNFFHQSGTQNLNRFQLGQNSLIVEIDQEVCGQECEDVTDYLKLSTLADGRIRVDVEESAGGITGLWDNENSHCILNQC